MSVSVSVIIPAYKHRDYIAAAIESVLSQSYTDFEVIVVNDGSPDDTGEVLHPYVTADRIKYFEQPNTGQAAARNRGLSQARGEFVAFLDDDDLWPSDKLEWQVSALRRSPDAVACLGLCGFVGEGAETMKNLPLRQGLTREDLLWTNVIMSPGQALIRREALMAAGGFGHVRGGADDWDCWIRLRALGEFHVEPRQALIYRLHQANASRDAVAMVQSALKVVRRHTSRSTKPSRGQVVCHLLNQVSVFLAHYSARAVGRGELRGGIRGFACLSRCGLSAGLSLKAWELVFAGYWSVIGAAVRSRFAGRTRHSSATSEVN